MKQKAIFLTGATGLVGSYLLKLLLISRCKVFVLVRKVSKDNPKQRIIKTLRFWGNSTIYRLSENLVILEGDITKRNLGLSNNTIKRIIGNIDEIYHCAALTDFNATLQNARQVNVSGTMNVLELGLKCRAKGKLVKVNYISTVFICGDHKGIFDEGCLNVGQNFKTTYERSKYEAELLVQKYRKKGLHVNVFRPPIIIGESSTGKILTLNQAFYQILHVLNSGVLKYFPNDKNFKIRAVCVDELCKSILKISESTLSKNGNYHTYPIKGINPIDVLRVSQKILKYKKPIIVSKGEFMEKSTYAQKMLLKYNLFFIDRETDLSSKKTNDILGKLNFRYLRYGDKLLTNILKYTCPIKGPA